MQHPDRRAVLRGAALLGIGGLAGCTGGSVESPTVTSTETAGETEEVPLEDGTESGSGATESPEPTPTSPTLGEASLSSDGGACGSGASVTIEATDEGFRVRGDIEAPTPCHDATLEDLSVADRTVHVGIGLEDDGSEVCSQCIATVPFELDVPVTAGSVGMVVVELEGNDPMTEKSTLN